jgi:lysylphosphatidylglycerol synthetase-like protein (DUF2156 family)
MEITLLVLAVAVCVAAFYFGKKATLEFNERCEQQFNFRPINLKHIAISASPFIIVLLGVGFDNGRNSINTIASIIISAAVIGILYRYIKTKTSAYVARVSIAVLLVYGLGFIAILLALFSRYIADRNNDGRSISEKMGLF